MSASKTNFFQGIASLLKEMSKTFTDLSKRVIKLEKRIEKNDEEMKILVQQHLELLKQIKLISSMQTEIANQIVKNHEDTETLYKALGLKKDLSYYSFNLMDAEEH